MGSKVEGVKEKASGSASGESDGADGAKTRGDGSERKDEALRMLVDEKKLAEAIGVRVRFVVKWRRANAAYGVCSGGRMGLTPAGAVLCARSFTQKKIEPAELELERVGVSVVVFMTPPNERVLLCKRLDNDELVTVAVADNRCFRAGDEFAAEIGNDGSLKKNGVWPDRGW